MEYNKNINVSIFEQLKTEARYALVSFSRDLVYEVYGKAKMAHQLQALTWDQFTALNNALIYHGINNSDWIQKRPEFQPNFEQ